MTPGPVSEKVVVAKLEAIRSMLGGIASLPLGKREEFLADPRMVAAGESFLRRALEALLDLGRHVAARGFGVAVAEYRGIADALEAHRVLSHELSERVRQMASYRNRLVHFYNEVTPEELYGILTSRVGDVTEAAAGIQAWLAADPGRLDRSL
jgi:uncharacterized protein YutE (UPF0331/DUF86 family)